MVPSTDEQVPTSQTATSDRAPDQPDKTAQAPEDSESPAVQTQQVAQTTPPSQTVTQTTQHDQIPPPPPHFLLYTVLGLFCIGVSLWLVFSWTGYRDRYSQQVEGWHLGATKMVEVTLIRDDKKNLACASDQSFEGIHCAFHSNHAPWGPGPEEDINALQPYNTVKNELFLGSGLWLAPALRGELPETRFTVVCNYHVKGVLKSVSLRWSPTSTFSPVDHSLAVGTLTDCVIPR